MMANSDYDGEDIVPLGELRPSREAFGPVPGAKSARPAKRDSTARPAARQQDPRQQAARSSSGSRSQGARPPAPRRQDGQAQRPAPSRSTAQRPARPQDATQPPARRSPAPARSPRGQAPARADQFASKLAEASRLPVVTKPQSGWRGALLKGTFGVVNVGLSSSERTALELRSKVRRPVDDGTIAVFSRKGGVGKTTISAYLGATLAQERGGRIVALDGDAEAGSLGWLLAPKAPSTLAALASADPIPADYASLRRYTTATRDGLEVIVGDPAEMGPISNLGLEAVAAQLSRHYDISIFDTGAGVTRATGKVLVNAAKVLLLVMGTSVDSVRAAERTLAWLDERPGEAADPNVRVVAVINGIAPDTKASHIDRIESHFADRCDAVVRIPWDNFLAGGSSAVDLDQLAKPTRQAFLELAATTIGTLARPQRSATLGRRHAS